MAKVTEVLGSIGGRSSLILGVLAFFISGAVVWFLWNQGPDYQVLFTRISAEDSGAVIEKLKEKRVPYKVEGSTISVPAEKVYEMRMELAAEGLPQGGGVGFEIFDKTSFGVTDFVQKVNYRRALQGELARTITQIKEIESARVHLALPEKGVFLEEEKRARASIIVKLKPGKSLSSGQVNAVVHLVANSFDNLRPEDVSVVDTSGKLWTKASTEGDAALGMSAGQLDYKRSLERDIETRIQTMLEKTVGANKAVVRVSADVDTRRIERTEETYNPEGQVVRSEQRNKEKTIGGTVTMGVPGVMSNLPDGQPNPSAQTSTPSQTQRQDEVINYEISKAVTRVVEPVSSIKRLTIAVLVDGTYEAVKAADGAESKKFVPRPEDEIAKFTEMVKSAAGFSRERGDVITVVSTPFEADFAEAVSEEGLEKPSSIPPYLVPMLIKYGTIVLIAVFSILFILRPIIKRLTEENAALESIQRNFPNGLVGGKEDLALEAGPSHVPDGSLERLKKMVKENPQQVAMVLRGWIKEK